MRLRVDGVRNFADYAALVDYVRGIGLVQNAELVSVDGDRLELELGLQGSMDQLFNLIALDRDLLPVSGGDGAAESLLHYRWMR